MQNAIGQGVSAVVVLVAVVDVFFFLGSVLTNLVANNREVEAQAEALHVKHSAGLGQQVSHHKVVQVQHAIVGTDGLVLVVRHHQVDSFLGVQVVLYRHEIGDTGFYIILGHIAAIMIVVLNTVHVLVITQIVVIDASCDAQALIHIFLIDGCVVRSHVLTILLGGLQSNNRNLLASSGSAFHMNFHADNTILHTIILIQLGGYGEVSRSRCFTSHIEVIVGLNNKLDVLQVFKLRVLGIHVVVSLGLRIHHTDFGSLHIVRILCPHITVIGIGHFLSTLGIAHGIVFERLHQDSGNTINVSGGFEHKATQSVAQSHSHIAVNTFHTVEFQFTVVHHSGNAVGGVAGDLDSVRLDNAAFAVAEVEVTVLVGTIVATILTVFAGYVGAILTVFTHGLPVGLHTILVPVTIGTNGPFCAISAIGSFGLDVGLHTILIPVAIGSDCPLDSILTVLTVCSVFTKCIVLGLCAILVPVTIFTDGPHNCVGTVGDGVLLAIAERDLNTITNLLNFCDHTTIGNQGVDLVERLFVGVQLLLKTGNVIIIVLTGREHTHGSYKE